MARLVITCWQCDGSGRVCEVALNGHGKASMHVGAVRLECAAQFAIQVTI